MAAPLGTTDSDGLGPRSEVGADRWPVFICYRQSDGKDVAELIYELLHEQRAQLLRDDGTASSSVELDVYFDLRAAAVGDWTLLHQPHLQRARAFIIVCTPGAKLDEGDGDWVHREIGWWLENRPDTAPILVDALGEEGRYVPDKVHRRWPNAQRIQIVPREWQRLADAERRDFESDVLTRFLGGIVPSGKSIYRQELEQEQARVAELETALTERDRSVTKLRRNTRVLGLGACALAAAIAFGFLQRALLADALADARDKLRQSLVAQAALRCSAPDLGAREAGLDAIHEAGKLGTGVELRDLLASCFARMSVTLPSEVTSSQAGMRADTTSNPPSRHEAQFDLRAVGLRAVWRDLPAADASELSFKDASTGGERGRWLLRSDTLKDLAFHPSGKTFVASVIVKVDGLKHELQLFDLITQEHVEVLVAEERFNGWSSGMVHGTTAFSRSGRYLAAAGVNGTVRVWELETGGHNRGSRLVMDVRPFPGEFPKLAFSPEEDLLAVQSGGNLQVWSFLEPRLVSSGAVSVPSGIRQLDPLKWPRADTLHIGGQAFAVKRPLMVSFAPEQAFEGSRRIEALEFSSAEQLLAMGGQEVRTPSLQIQRLAEAGRAPRWNEPVSARALSFAGSDSLLRAFGYSGYSEQDPAGGGQTQHQDGTRGVLSSVETADGRSLAAGTRATVVMSARDLLTGRERWSRSFAGSIETLSAALASGADRVAVTYRSPQHSSVRIQDGDSGSVIEQPVEDGELFVRDGRFMVLDRDTLRARDVETGRWSLPLRREPSDYSRWRGRFVASSDGAMMAETLDTGEIWLWNLAKRAGRVLGRLSLQNHQRKRFSSSNHILVAYDQHQLAAWDVRTSRELARIDEDEIIHFQFADEAGDRVHFLKRDGSVHDWTLRDGTTSVVSRLDTGAADWFFGDFFDAGPGIQIGMTARGRVKVWSLASGQVVADYEFARPEIERILVEARANCLITAHEQVDLAVWDLAHPEQSTTLGPASHFGAQARLGVGGRSVSWVRSAWGREEHAIEVVDVAAGKAEASLPLPDEPHCLAMGGSSVIAACLDDRVMVFDAQRGAHEFSDSARKPAAVAFDGAAERMVILDEAGSISLWNVAEQERHFTLQTSLSQPTAVALSRTGRWLAAGDEAGVVRVWDLAPLFAEVDALEASPARAAAPSRSSWRRLPAWLRGL
jgi:WD40 repeat protein